MKTLNKKDEAALKASKESKEGRKNRLESMRKLVTQRQIDRKKEAKKRITRNDNKNNARNFGRDDD